VAGTIDDEVKTLIDKAYAHCAEILRANEEKLHQIVDFLMEHETMSGCQFVQCMTGEEISKGSDTAMLDDISKTE
jgi:cell division protease FtsH